MLNIYRASAGSGKTFRLTKDYIGLLFDSLGKYDRPHRRILAVTFTNKATDEMKSRILQELHALARGEKSDYRADLMKEFTLTENEVNQRAGKILIRILHDYSSFSISTIDKFFQQVVRSFAREIGISGGYNLELDTETTLQQAVENLYMDLSAKGNEQLLSWMTDFLKEQIEDGKSWRVDKEITNFGREIFKENYQHKAEEISEKLHNKEFLKQYRKKLRLIISDFDKEVADEVGKALHAISSQGISGADFSGKKLESNLLKISPKKDYDLSKNTTIAKFADDVENCWNKTAPTHIKEAIENAYNNGLGESLRNITELLTRGIIPYNTAKIINKHLSTLGILSDLALQIKRLTNEQNIMLLADTNLLLNKIIDDSETPFVYERTGVNIDHYMIDEFQDTSLLQWKNFKPLISNSLASGGKNMVVGDVKQSIYRWRNSDWKLLDQQVYNDFSSLQIKQNTLDVNWRSDKNIIHFNNSFFKHAAGKLQEKLNAGIGPAGIENPNLEALKSKISHAYSDIEQHVSGNAESGHVQIQFVDKEGIKADWETAVLEKIPALLEELVDRGFKPKDVAFLVRNNDHATTLINYLVTFKNSPGARPGFSYEIVGNEGLTMTSSSSVNFIISTLKLIFNPNDDVNRAIMQYEYQLGKLKRSEDESVRSCLTGKGEGNAAQSTLFTDEENACLEEMSHLSLFEATEKLISVFQLEKWYGETVFLQAFQDLVFKFINNRNADLNSFLSWWDENGEKQFINAPENEQAFRVMTIHKSKGLDFKVVIIPFCNWNIDAAGFTAPLLWCETSLAPFDELPLMPVQYSKVLENTIFRNEYFDEQMHQFVDNLNLAYVAFTRARNEMICFAEAPSDTSLKNLTKISDLLFNSLNENDDLSHCWNEDKTVFEIGEPTRAVYKVKKTEGISKKLTSYPVSDSSDRLKIRHTSADYWKTASISESRVNYGTIMHDILRQTICRGDEEKAIILQLSSGKISQTDLPEIRQELERFWSLPEVDEWFDHSAEVLNEATILHPEGYKYRPDRVILKNNNATVIDYKFGQEERAFHIGQLRGYSDFLTEMGYKPVKACLYYVSLGKLITI